MDRPAFPPPSAFADLIRLAVAEDLGEAGDVTSALTVPADLVGVGTLFQKSPGVACGLPIVAPVCAAFDGRLRVENLEHVGDGEGRFSDAARTPLLRVVGPMRSLLAAERTLLNFVQRMSGVATLTRRYVDAVAGTRARVLDTRKTLPGFRALDKYAVRVGGGHNHRVGLYDMVLVKDNHIAQLEGSWAERLEACVRASKAVRPSMQVEVEVDTVEQFGRVLAMGGVDVVLLDNMDCPTMRRCVERRDEARDASGRAVLLEASGGVTLETIAAIARTGVDRISVGALTHSAPAMDISLDLA